MWNLVFTLVFHITDVGRMWSALFQGGFFFMLLVYLSYYIAVLQWSLLKHFLQWGSEWDPCVSISWGAHPANFICKICWCAVAQCWWLLWSTGRQRGTRKDKCGALSCVLLFLSILCCCTSLCWISEPECTLSSRHVSPFRFSAFPDSIWQMAVLFSWIFTITH